MWLSDRDGQIVYKTKLIYIHYWICCYRNIKSKTIKKDILYNTIQAKAIVDIISDKVNLR